jgi:serine phosphatase RsbU (regulator of sigma subunit)
MTQMVEIAWDSLCKHGEELCGDWVKITTTPEDLIVALSDGLGSGVKANILATLTAEIASSMLVRGASIDDVVETLAETLPECRVRHLAYATFAVLRVYHGREAYLVEYDSPAMVLVRNGKATELPMVEREIAGRKIREGHFTLQQDDYMVMLSDGYLHAGVGGLYRMGWGWKNIATAVQRWASTYGDTHELAGALSRTCMKLYNGAPGDDATAITMRVRPTRKATILTGPPSNPELDCEAVHRLM